METEQKENSREEYDDFLNEQFKILKGHFDRTMLRCFNKLVESKI